MSDTYMSTDFDLDVSIKVGRVVSIFPKLSKAKIKPIFALKKSKNGNRYVFGKLVKTTALTRFLTSGPTTEGFDYFLFIDYNIYSVIDDSNKTKLIAEILKYADVKINGESSYKYDVKKWFNQDLFQTVDTGFLEKINEIAIAVYENPEQVQLSLMFKDNDKVKKDVDQIKADLTENLIEGDLDHVTCDLEGTEV